MIPSTDQPVAARPLRLWDAFAFPLFRAIWLAAFVSNIGTWMQNMAGVWLLTTLASSQVLVALMQTATSLPVFLLSIPAGALADLIDRRRLLLMTQGFMAVVALSLGIGTLLHIIRPEAILGFTFLLGIGAALNGPAWQSLTPELVSRQVLPVALTLNGVSINLSRAIGPALGGLIIAYYSPGYVFLLNGISFGATFLVIYRWQRTPVTRTLPVEDFVTALRAGIRYVWFTPLLHAILIRAFAFTFGASALWALLSLVVARQLHMDSGVYGLMLTWLGAGAVTGALVLTRLTQQLSANVRIFMAILAFMAVNVCIGLVTSLWVLYPVLFLAGMAWLMALTSLNVSVQLNLPKWVQARVLSIYQLVFQGGMALGSIVWGTVAGQYGLSVTFLLAAGWMAVSTLLAIPFRLPVGEVRDFSPAERSTHPTFTGVIQPEQGPVVVMVEYRVRMQDQPAFLKAMEELKRLRRRDGALRGGVFTDATDPERQVEFFVVASWAEHLRQHQRLTNDDLHIQQAVRQYHIGPDRPKVHHFVAPSEDSMPVAMNDTTKWENGG
nr:MFS transporter [uncultured Arsenicibacter sp.]